MQVKYISFTNLVENIDTTPDVVNYEYVRITGDEYKDFLTYIEKEDSSIIGKYKFLYIFETNYTNCPGVQSMCFTQEKKIIEEIEDWVLTDETEHKNAYVNLSKTYSYFLKPGIYRSDEHYVKVTPL